MQMFLKPLTELAEYDEIRSRLKKRTGIISLSGCARAQKAHMIYGLSFDAQITLVIAENDLAARSLHEDLLLYVCCFMNRAPCCIPRKICCSIRRISRATCWTCSACGSFAR